MSSSKFTDLQIAQRLVRTAQSAKNREKEFNMSFKRMKQLMNTKTCFITGEELQTDDETLSNYLSLERLDNSKGYTDDNVVACTRFMNQKKSDLTVEDIVLMYKALKKKRII